jgi:hypothetical protein
VASVGSKGDSYGNALAETINGLYKTEVVRKEGPVAMPRGRGVRHIGVGHWFNNHRLLEPIGDIPPAEFEGLYRLEQAANDTVGLKESGLRQTRGDSVSGKPGAIQTVTRYLGTKSGARSQRECLCQTPGSSVSQRRPAGSGRP